MKKSIVFMVLLASLLGYAQEQTFDKIELKNGKVYKGKIEKVGNEFVTFKDDETELITEIRTKDISYILLANGKIVDFDDEQNVISTDSTENVINNSVIFIGFNAGYSLINMKDVNKDLQDSENLFASVGAITDDPKEITGGLYIDGNVKINLGQFRLGVSGNYLSSSGEFSYNEAAGSYTETYNVNTIELIGIFETVFNIKNSSTQLFLLLGGGLGIASAEHLGDFIYYPDPSQNIKVNNDVTGKYFAGRIKGGFQFYLKKVILEIGVGYRIANAGELKGTHIENGVKYTDQPVRDINGNAIEFDYSGLLFSAGITFKL